jgi:hypothetical protein
MVRGNRTSVEAGGNAAVTQVKLRASQDGTRERTEDVDTETTLKYLDAWDSGQPGIGPPTLGEALAALRELRGFVRLLRLRYEECAQCHVSLSEPPPGCPPHCDDCTVDDAHLEAWDEAVGN